MGVWLKLNVRIFKMWTCKVCSQEFFGPEFARHQAEKHSMNHPGELLMLRHRKNLKRYVRKLV